MNDEMKKKINEKYEASIQNAERFWPDSIYKDLLVSFALFILLIGLAYFLGVHPEPKVDPTDATYVPRPEWYFLFLFEFLKYFPGELEWVGAAVIPGILVMALIFLPLYDKNPFRHNSKRKLAVGIMSFIVSHAGIIYEQNLGPDGADIAKEMLMYNPDSNWVAVKEVNAPENIKK